MFKFLLKFIITGGENIRPYWSRYFDGIHAIIYVIDGLCTHSELEQNRSELIKLLDDPTLQNLPWLILCNKQDLEGASTHLKVFNFLWCYCRSISLRKRFAFNGALSVSQNFLLFVYLFLFYEIVFFLPRRHRVCL